MNWKNFALGCVGMIVLAVALSVGGLISSYNGLVQKDQTVSKQWAQVQNVYQRRADLIPNLVGTVQGAANFEKSTLVEVTQARSRVGQATLALPPSGTAPTQDQLNAFQQAQGQLGSALSRLLVVSEKYPQLTATEGFRDLQAQLEGTENRITVERQHFNDAAQDYDTALRSFPTVLYAGIFGFHERPYFTATPGSETAPKVNFDFNGKP